MWIVFTLTSYLQTTWEWKPVSTQSDIKVTKINHDYNFNTNWWSQWCNEANSPESFEWITEDDRNRNCMVMLISNCLSGSLITSKHLNMLMICSCCIHCLLKTSVTGSTILLHESYKNTFLPWTVSHLQSLNHYNPQDSCFIGEHVFHNTSSWVNNYI